MSRTKGFTLIELLVAVAIITMLIAVTLPALQRARKQARATICHAYLKQWGTTLGLYVEDSQGHLPNSLIGDAGMWFLRGSFVSSDDPNIFQSLNPVDTEGIACCPMAMKAGKVPFRSSAGTGSNSLQVEGTLGSTFEAWEMTSPGRPFRSSYGYNERLFGGKPFGFDSSVPFRTRLLGPDIFSLSGRANIPVLLDATYPSGRPDERDSPPRSSGRPGPGIATFCIDRHDGCVNGLFLDWSVSTVGLKELWALKWHMQFNTSGPWTRAGGAKAENWPQWMRRFRDY